MTKPQYNEAIDALNSIVNNDTITLKTDRFDPCKKVAYDIKFLLFNRNYLEYGSSENGLYVEDLNPNSRYFYAKLLTEVVSIFHLYNDLRQHFLISNNVEYFFTQIYTPHSQGEYTKFDEAN